MALVILNNYAITEKIEGKTMQKLQPAMADMARDLREEIVESAGWAGSSALANRGVYDIESGTHTKGMKMGFAKVLYNNLRLWKPIGSDTSTWSHTSPTGDNPRDYRDLVNSGNAGALFTKEPAWAGNGGFWDEAMEQAPTIVSNTLRKYGII